MGEEINEHKIEMFYSFSTIMTEPPHNDNDGEYQSHNKRPKTIFLPAITGIDMVQINFL